MTKYSPKARETIEQTMEQFKRGKLKAGRSNKKVTSRDQAVAIGISEAANKTYKTPKHQ